ncbi:hypothetical protein LOTGIDRAFT_234501 [Lottia gigantea]|uniref:PiggyBac transposable element-derived protein domain-containing protein n=1 Tax=Lottia gigantea TaxID=225164 RepID=V4A593_LOTGI|nr:hypothetical protein LOTGIDRAFT_234501 [Lottia gigantea]ESO88411.1 hypothetical protein LOTGIDRAFT_234501 [Lottia gigantea]
MVASFFSVRLCAVFGGTYCLMTGVHSVLLDQQNKCQAIITNAGQRINCKWLIMGTSYSPEKYIQSPNTKKISRCILLTDRSLLQTDTQEARRIFKKICPDEIFLPKPPHPDDIIYVDESEATSGGGETWDGQKVEGEAKDNKK